MSRKISFALVMLALAAAATLAPAANYVNWNGGFWFALPDGWMKIDYRYVDRFLVMTDTSREVFNYEAVFSPNPNERFGADAYLVVTFDSLGPLSEREADSALKEIASSYATQVFEAPVVQLMTDLVPGQPKIDYATKSVSILSEMAYRPGAEKKVWQFIRLNDRGIISLYFYSADSTYLQNKPLFDSMVNSLSFADLKEAAGQESLKFTAVGGESVAESKVGETETGGTASNQGGGLKKILLYAVVIVVIVGLIWGFVFARRR
jgi:hypothetical protein